MSDEDDFFKAIADFVKGKGGPPDADTALISFDDDFDPSTIDFRELSHSFGEFAVEYPTVRRAMSRYRLQECLALLGGMTTLPELQANAFRLGVLAHLAFIHARGKSRAQPGQIIAWFNQLDNGTCGRQEDAAEDVFTSNVTYEGNTFRVFEGTSEGNRFHTQLFLAMVEHMPDSGVFKALKSSVGAILRLSDNIAERAGLPAYILGNVAPRSLIGKPDKGFSTEMRSRVVFSAADLAALNISRRDLAPFIVAQDDFHNLAEFSVGHTPLEAMPVVEAKNGIIVFLPSAIGLAIRHLVISRCIKAGMQTQLEEALSRAYISHFANEGILKSSPPPLRTQRIDGQTVAQLIREVDAGRYLHLLFVFDNFQGYQDGAFMTSNATDENSEIIRKCIDHAHETCSSKDGFREGLTIIVPCGWGRFFGIGLNEMPSSWRSEMIPPHDLLTLNHTPSFKVLDVFRALDAQHRFEALGFGLINGNGFLNLYGLLVGNGGHIIKHERFRHQEDEKPIGGIQIPLTCVLEPRLKANFGADIKAIRGPEGETVRLRRVHGSPRYGTDELSPFYADVEALEQRKYRSVYIGDRNLYWIETTAATGLDPHMNYQLLNMANQWAEFVFKYLDEKPDIPYGKVLLCKLHFCDAQMPDGSDELPSDEDITSLFVLSGTVRHETYQECEVTVLDGFLSATRRVDNFAERGLAQAVIKSCLEMLEIDNSPQLLASVTQDVVKSDRARHFHAFAVPKPRDFIREDLEERAITISRFDDATIRLGLGWMAQDRSDPHKIEGIDACTSYLKKLVQALVVKFRSDLSKFNRGELVEFAVRNHECASKETDTWKRTFGAVEALSDEASLASEAAISEITKLNGACLASRIVAEAAICESPIDGGFTPGVFDLSQLMATASLMHYLGGFSDAIMSGAMPPKIEISAAGEVMMDHGFSDEVIQPFGQVYQGKGLASAADNYSSHYEERPPTPTETSHPEEQNVQEERYQDALNAEFAQVWEEEFGFSFEIMKSVWNGFFNVLEDDRKAAFSLKHSELVSRLEQETSISAEEVTKCITPFVYGPRKRWDSAPDGIGDWAWSPWRFQRALSVVTRPIIQLDELEDPTLLVAPAMISEHLNNFIVGARTGWLERRLFRKNGPIFKWIDRMNSIEGEAFNEKVAEELRSIGWQAQANLSDGQIFNRKKTPGFGDVDVLAWNPSDGRVLVIECKDLAMDRTISEIAKRLKKYQGEVSDKGRKDDLRKHLDRCETIDAEKDKVEAFTGMSINEITRVLMFSEATPLQFSKITERHNVTLLTFADIKERFEQLAEP